MNNWLAYLSDSSQTLADSISESEWLSCDDALSLQLFVPRLKINDRRVRLFACACCRRIWDLLTDCRSHTAVEVAESFADGFATLEELRQAQEGAIEAARAVEGQNSEQSAACATGAASKLEGSLLAHGVVQGVAFSIGTATGLDYLNECEEEAWEKIVLEAEKNLLVLFRDIVANPFHPISLNPAWLTPTVLDLARAAYDERILPSGELDPQRLAVLSDALEEAGCDNEDILNHLRSPGPHVRGCWVVDLLLAKR